MPQGHNIKRALSSSLSSELDTEFHSELDESEFSGRLFPGVRTYGARVNCPDGSESFFSVFCSLGRQEVFQVFWWFRRYSFGSLRYSFHFLQYILLIFQLPPPNVWFYLLTFSRISFSLFFCIGKPELDCSLSNCVVVLLGSTIEIQISCRRLSFASRLVVIHCLQMHPEPSRKCFSPCTSCRTKFGILVQQCNEEPRNSVCLRTHNVSKACPNILQGTNCEFVRSRGLRSSFSYSFSFPKNIFFLFWMFCLSAESRIYIGLCGLSRIRSHELV